MRRIPPFLLLICFAVFLTGCPKSTPKQPLTFKSISGEQKKVLAEFENELAKYECLMSGRIWSETSTSKEQQIQQEIEQAGQRQAKIIQRLAELNNELSRLQTDWETQDDGFVTEQNRLNRLLLAAKNRDSLLIQLDANRDTLFLKQQELARLSSKDSPRRRSLQLDIQFLTRVISELERQIPADLPGTDQLNLDLAQSIALQKRQEKRFNDQKASKQTEQSDLNVELGNLQSRQKSLLQELQSAQRETAQLKPKEKINQVFVGCTASQGGQPSAQQKLLARTVRDDITYELIRYTDVQYFQFENDLYIGRATGSVLADITDFGANLAATISNGERAKTIINASLIAFRGSRKSVALNFFQEQTADVLITKMQTSRNRILKEILTQIKDKDVDQYPLDAALGDVIKYFYAGTLPRALQELKTDTGTAARIAEDDVLILKGVTPTTPATQAQRNSSVNAFKILQRLAADSILPAGETSNAAVTKALGKLQSIAEKIKADTEIKAAMEKSDALKDLAKQLTTNSTDGAKLAQTVDDIRYELALERNIVEKIDKIIVDADKN